MKFFHNSMLQHRHSNRITSIRDTDGNKLSNHREIEIELVQYYSTLMKEPQENMKETIKKITKNIPQLITEEHNEALMREILMEEVEQGNHGNSQR
jgi:hypothetical protein